MRTDDDAAEPTIVLEPTTDMRLYGADLAWQAYWSDAPNELAYGRDEDDARDWLDIQYPRRNRRAVSTAGGGAAP